MKNIQINSVTIEQTCGRWLAYANGISGRANTPMLAYIAYLKAEADQTTQDLMEQYFSIQADSVKMREVQS